MLFSCFSTKGMVCSLQACFSRLLHSVPDTCAVLLVCITMLCVALHVPCVCRRAGDLFGQRNILLKAKAVLTRGLAGVENVYTQVTGCSYL